MSEISLVPIKTRILTDKDNIVDIIEEYGKEHIGPDDIVCVAESVVAITQGRMVRPEDLTPSWQARLMNRFVPSAGSMSSLYGMQAAMELEGEWKMLFAFIAGMFGKLIGKNGVFYSLAREASLTDDVTGTMPPFDKHIVYGPANPNGVAEKIKLRLGCFGACVADVNDLKRSAVLGTSKGLHAGKLAKMLIDNPFGNDSQMTPIVVIKGYRQAAKGRE